MWANSFQLKVAKKVKSLKIKLFPKYLDQSRLGEGLTSTVASITVKKETQ
jgi:hypothetical protein